MPKVPIDYSNAVIYKIVCQDLAITDLYIGSTTHFTKRKATHKYECIRNKQLKIYQIINANGGWGNWIMLEIEKFTCKDSNELRARERYWCEELKPVLNMNNPFFIQKEYDKVYYVANHNAILEKKKTYYIINKDTILEKRKIYYTSKKELKELKEQDLLCSIETDLVLKEIIIL